MNILRKIQEVLAIEEPAANALEVGSLGTILEYFENLKTCDVMEGVKLLLDASLQEKDEQVKRELFGAIYQGIWQYHLGERLNWDQLVATLPSLRKWELVGALDVLSCSGQASYISGLRLYTYSDDLRIREAALQAIQDIEHSVAHRAEAQREREELDLPGAIQDALALVDPDSKALALEGISDLFKRFDDLNPDEIAEGVTRLLPAFYRETDEAVQEELLHAVYRGVLNYELADRFDWDRLAGMLPELDGVTLIYALELVILARQARYVPLLQPYTHSDHPYIVETVVEALEDAATWHKS